MKYAATATIQGQGTTPDADTQVQAIQSRVTAVATDPALVQSRDQPGQGQPERDCRSRGTRSR